MNKITSTKVIELLLNGWQLGLSGGLNRRVEGDHRWERYELT